MGAIGLGNQGLHNLKSFLTFDDVRVLAVCDVDRNHLQRAKKIVDDAYGDRDCAAYGDFRDVLARGDIDTVLIATPDHCTRFSPLRRPKPARTSTARNRSR